MSGLVYNVHIHCKLFMYKREITKDLLTASMFIWLTTDHLINSIVVLCSNGTSKGSNNNQPLVQWSEVPGHVGLMYCMTQSTNNPVVLMIKPDAMLVQEIKVVPAKAKVCIRLECHVTLVQISVQNIFLSAVCLHDCSFQTFACFIFGWPLK